MKYSLLAIPWNTIAQAWNGLCVFLSVSPVVRRYVIVSLLSLCVVAQSHATVDFKNAASLKSFYRQYLTFLQQIDRLDQDLYDPFGFDLQDLVSEHYYYPSGVKSRPLSDEDGSAFVRNLIKLSMQGVEVGGKKEYPYIVVNAADRIDLKIARKFNRDVLQFTSFSLSAGDHNVADAPPLEDRILNASLIEFYPLDFYQRISDVLDVGKMVINIKKDKIPQMMDFLLAIQRDPKFGHRVLKAAIAGPKFYDKTAEKVVLYFSGSGQEFTKKINQHVVGLLARWSSALLSYHPVGMYPVAKGISYRTFSKLLAKNIGQVYHWGLIEQGVRDLDSRLLYFTEKLERKDLMASRDKLKTLKLALTHTDTGVKGDTFLYYFNNPALMTAYSNHFSGARFHEDLGIVAAQLRALKYHAPDRYRQYIEGLDNYSTQVFSQKVSRVLVQLDESGSNEALRSKAQNLVVRQLKLFAGTPVRYPKKAGAFLGQLVAMAGKQTLWREKDVLIHGRSVVKARQSNFLGVAQGCCSGFAVLSNQTFQRYGVYGLRVLLNRVLKQDSALINFIYAASSVFADGFQKNTMNYMSLEDAIRGLDFGEDRIKTEMLRTKGHVVMIGNQDNKYYLFDPNFGLFSFYSPDELLQDLATLMDKYYAYFDGDNGEKLVGIYDLPDLSSIQRDVGGLNSRLALLDVSVNDTVEAFGNEYLAQSEITESAELALSSRDFYRHHYQPISAFSEIAFSAIKGIVEGELPPPGGGVKGFYADQFKRSYRRYIAVHSLNRPASIVDNQRLKVEIARALIVWGGKLIPGFVHPRDEENRVLVSQYMSKHDMTLYTNPDWSDWPLLVVRPSQLTLNLPPDQLVDFYTKLPQFLTLPGIKNLVQSIKVSALDGYTNSEEPIVFHLLTDGWDTINRLRDALMDTGILPQTSAWSVDYPGQIDLGFGLHYAELPGQAVRAFEGRGRLLGEPGKIIQSVNYINVLAYLFSETLNAFVSRNNQDGRAFELKNFFLETTGRSDRTQWLAFFLGRLDISGFDVDNLALASNQKLDWRREKAEFYDNIDRWNKYLLAAGDSIKKGYLNALEEEESSAWFEYNKMRLAFEHADYRYGFLIHLRRGGFAHDELFREFNALYRSHQLSNDSLIKIASNSVALAQLTRNDAARLIQSDFEKRLQER